jgi:hypothetical protein
MSDQTPAHRDEGSSSVGRADLRHAVKASHPATGGVGASRLAPSLQQLGNPAVPGSDPYNSTGGFDRNNAWNRIRKR